MQTRYLISLALSSLSSASLFAQNLVVNGDFEDGTGTAFYATTGWYNCGVGLKQGTTARTDKGAVITGFFSATINDRYNSVEGKFGPVVHSQKTKYVIKAGDSFTLTYDWRPADSYWQTGRDTVRFVLYATSDDRMAGPVVWSSEHTSDLYRGSIDLGKNVFAISSVVKTEAVGKALFINFYGVDTVDGVEGSHHYARVDNIVVEVSKK
jgi:hypothetical protein